MGCEPPSVRISGWSCQADTPAAQRSFIGCTLNRLILLSAGNDPKIAELFARAELRRDTCSAPVAPANSIASGEIPLLRGPLISD